MDNYFYNGQEWIRGKATAADVGAWLAIISMLQARFHDAEEYWVERNMVRLHKDIMSAFDIELEKRAQ